MFYFTIDKVVSRLLVRPACKSGDASPLLLQVPTPVGKLRQKLTPHIVLLSLFFPFVAMNCDSQPNSVAACCMSSGVDPERGEGFAEVGTQIPCLMVPIDTI